MRRATTPAGRTATTDAPLRVRLLALASFAVFACAASHCPRALAQAGAQAKPTPAPAASQPAPPGRELTDEEQQLVRGSKDAILGAGISEAYFDEHFTLRSVFNRPGDRRVVWRFRVGGYEATLTDALGSYTDQRGRRVDSHSVANSLPGAHDITKTITPQRARRIMRSCLGPFDGGAVVYGPGAEGRAALVFTAASRPLRTRASEREREERERAERRREERERERRGAARRGNTPGGADAVEEEDEGGPPVFIGAVDLETGRCTKGLALAGPPPPKPAARRRGTRR